MEVTPPSQTGAAPLSCPPAPGAGVSELADARSEAVEIQAAELRRIERDLHDGAQARLVSSVMTLGMAIDAIEKDPAAAQAMLQEAQATNRDALADLRTVVRGIHRIGRVLRRRPLEADLDVAVVDVRLPPMFTDEGLRVAIDARRRRPGLAVMVLSQYIEQLYARELLSDGDGSIGYLLKDRVSDVGDFVESVRQVPAGGTVMDPEVIAALLASRRRADDPLSRLTPRETEVLGLMAANRSNLAIAGRLVITKKVVSKHTYNIFTKLDLWQDGDDNRRVLAVLAYLRGRSWRVTRRLRVWSTRPCARSRNVW